MDLSTHYMGFDLAHPFLPGASPMVDDLDTVRRLEDAGAAGIVMHSLFEEQVVGEQVATNAFLDGPAESFGEAASYLPAPIDFALGPDRYMSQIVQIKKAVDIPVFASLNGSTRGGWLEFAELVEEAGADALELNVYQLATEPWRSGAEIESELVAMVTEVSGRVGIPLAVKLSPFFTSVAELSGRLDRAGADGLVLFNRFYQADIDVENLEVERALRLSDPSELLLRLRWLAILRERVKASLAVTGGVHGPVDAVKAIMAGADAVQVVSALLQQGPEYLSALRQGLAEWLEEHEYESLGQMRGSMSLARCPDPHAYERANYMHILQSWRGFVDH